MENDPLIENVRRFIDRERLLSPQDRVLVALSGGADSTCLLHLLAEGHLKPIARPMAAYVDHGLRSAPEIQGEIDFCRDLCRDLNLPFSVLKLDADWAGPHRNNLQARARTARYGALTQHAEREGATTLATGHHADDQAETLVMRLLRGSGPGGLSGIPPRRDWVVRPLLETSRQKIEGYLSKRKLRWIDDRSNSKNTYLRNRIRREIMPALRKENPEFAAAAGRTARLLREEDRWMDGQTERLLDELDLQRDGETVSFRGEAFEKAPTVLQRRALRKLLGTPEASPRSISLVHLENALRAVRNDGTGCLPHEKVLRREHDRYVISTSAGRERPSSYDLKIPGQIRLAGGSVFSAVWTPDDRKPFASPADANRIRVPEARMKGPLQIRFRKPGDRFQPAGMKGHKKLQDFFIDRKIPRSRRDRIPLLFCRNELVWVVGLRGDGRFVGPARSDSGRVAEFLYVP